MTRRLLLLSIAIVFLVLRAPALWQDLATDEIEHAGAARHLVLERDRRPSALVADGPLASHVGSPAAWALGAAAPEWDPAGPGDQAGWITLFETRTPNDELVPGGVMAVGLRLPFLLLGLLSLIFLERFAARFYGDDAAAAALVIVAGSAGLASTTAHAAPAGLAMCASVLLLVAFDDHVRALQYDGPPPPWLVRNRSLACGAAVAFALASSFAFVPIVALLGVWLIVTRRVVRGRGDRVHAGAVGRAIKGTLAAALLLALAYGVDFGAPLSEGDSHPALDALSGIVGLDPAATAEMLSSWTMPLPTWARGLAHAVTDALATTIDARLATVDAVDGVLLALLAVAGLGAVPMLSRDRVDTPILLAVTGYGALASALVLAPRHAEVAALAAIPPLSVLAGAWLVRMGRHFRLGAVVLSVALAAGVAGGWWLSGDSGPYVRSEGVPSPARVTPRDEWVAGRFIAAQAPERAFTVLGRETKLRIVDGTRIDEVAPGSLELRDAAEALGRGDPVVIVRGAWLPTPAVLRGDDVPTEPLGPRLVVHARPGTGDAAD